MDVPIGSSSSPYEGLKETSAEIFPLVCPRCQRRFTDVRDYVARTTPVFNSSGLLERVDSDHRSIVLLLRSCLCGSSLALRCHDRRSCTDGGLRRRSRFAVLVALLHETGVNLEEAQVEVRRLLQSTAA